MATYLEIAEIQSNAGWADFELKVRAACVKKATDIINSATPSAEALAWAKEAIANQQNAQKNIIWYVIGSNYNLAVSTILTASDSAIQTNVNTAIDAVYP